MENWLNIILAVLPPFVPTVLLDVLPEEWIGWEERRIEVYRGLSYVLWELNPR